MKYEKHEVGFEHPAKGSNHCFECRHFLAPHRCQIVQGYIERGDWCRKFKAKTYERRYAGTAARD